MFKFTITPLILLTTIKKVQYYHLLGFFLRLYYYYYYYITNYSITNSLGFINTIFFNHYVFCNYTRNVVTRCGHWKIRLKETVGYKSKRNME